MPLKPTLILQTVFGSQNSTKKIIHSISKNFQFNSNDFTVNKL